MTATGLELGDGGFTKELPAIIPTPPSPNVPGEGQGLEVVLHPKRVVEPANEAVEAHSSGPAASGELAVAVAGAEGVLGQLCTTFESNGSPAKSNYRVSDLCTTMFSYGSRSIRSSP